MTDLRTYELSRFEDSAIILLSALAGLVISFLMYRNIMFSAMIIPLIPRIRTMVSTSLADRRRQKYMDEFKDFLLTHEMFAALPLA